jgi:hypothetical protein
MYVFITRTELEINKCKLDTIVLYALEEQYVEIAVEAPKKVQIKHTGSNTITVKATGKVRDWFLLNPFC